MSKQTKTREQLVRDRAVSETYSKIIDEVVGLFERKGYYPGDNPKNPKAKPVLLLNLADAVGDIAQYLAEQNNVWSKDAIFIEDIPELIQASIVRTVERAAEPRLVLGNLLTQVPLEVGETWSDQYIGTIAGVTNWIGRNNEPPVAPAIQSASNVGATLREYGIVLSFSKEVIEASKWNVVQIHIEEAAKDMARFKEKEIYKMIAGNSTYRLGGSGVSFGGSNSVTHNGVTIYSHANGAVVTGRDPIALTVNYTCTLNDVFDMMAEVITLNEFPDTLILSPFAWSMFARNGEMREWAFMNGITPFMHAPQGDTGSLARLEGNGRNLGIQPSRSNQSTTFLNIPHFSKPMNIIVTPFAYYNTTGPVADIIMGPSGKFGAELVSPRGVETLRWEDPLHSLSSMKFTEYWNVQPIVGGDYIISGVDIALKPSARVEAQIHYTSLP